MRLINADSIHGFAKYIKRNENFEPYIMIDDLVKVIDEQPTAYSVDKVVEELECDRCESCSLLEVRAGSICCGKCHEKIIEIVKRGGVDDDVCEWKLTDTKKVMPYKTSCGNEDLYDNSYNYCPYCGKKLKVVE